MRDADRQQQIVLARKRDRSDDIGGARAVSVPGYHELAVHRDREASVVVLEYAVHGQAVKTGPAYNNHFVSALIIKDRNIAHWRDYFDPVAVFDALGWPTR